MIERAELICSHCQHSLVCGPAAMLEWLRGVGMVRRGKEPGPELIAELFRSAVPRFACPGCGVKALAARPVADEDDDNWGPTRVCDACGQPIARERLAAVPAATLCAGCQSRDERGGLSPPAEYCPRCGSAMVTRPTRTPGLTRYEVACPNCRG